MFEIFTMNDKTTEKDVGICSSCGKKRNSTNKKMDINKQNLKTIENHKRKLDSNIGNNKIDIISDNNNIDVKHKTEKENFLNVGDQDSDLISEEEYNLSMNE